jgi:two-component system, OmpR family, sensor kinase
VSAPRSIAGRRLRRIRWTMTLVFACTTALCLIVLGAIAANIDSGSRQHDLDLDLGQRATSLAQTVYFQDGSLRLARLTSDSVARTSQVFGVVSDHRIQLAAPNQAALPADAELETMIATATAKRRVEDVEAPTETGKSFQWATAPVLDGTRVGAVVIVGDSAGPSDAAHLRLVEALIATIVGLILVAGIAGHLLSGRAMRPALRGLEQQEQFLVEAAHELRTPLTTLRLVVDRGLRHPDDAPAVLDRVSVQIDRMGELVTNLLARARAEAGSQPIELVPLRLDQLVELTIGELRYAVDVRVVTDESIVQGNAELLRQAVRNLVENALRYAPGKGVTVRVARGTISVIDHGPGIPEDDRERVLTAGVGSGRGTGTGLAIVAWVAEVHHGSVRLSASDGGGLRVDLVLPTASSSAHRVRRILES